VMLQQGETTMQVEKRRRWILWVPKNCEVDDRNAENQVVEETH
jgi:hypothetical protein